VLSFLGQVQYYSLSLCCKSFHQICLSFAFWFDGFCFRVFGHDECFCTRVVVYLRFRFVFSLLGLSRAFGARLVACPCFHRRLPSFLAFAFVARFVACLRFLSSSASVLGFGFRSRLRHLFLVSDHRLQFPQSRVPRSRPSYQLISRTKINTQMMKTVPLCNPDFLWYLGFQDQGDLPSPSTLNFLIRIYLDNVIGYTRT
jgi:hypothetical protein